VQKFISAAWKTLAVIIFVIVIIFADDMWIDVLPYWFILPVFAAFAAFVVFDVMYKVNAFRWVYDKHTIVAEWIADRLIWIGALIYIISRTISMFT
jgi:hypothetical protein